MSIVALGPIGLMAIAVSIGVLTSAIFAINAAVNSANETKIKAFSESLSSLQTLLAFEGIEDSALKVVKAIKMIADEINKISEKPDAMVSFTTSMNSLNNVLTTAKTVTEDDIKPTKNFIQAAKEYYVAQATSKDVNSDALVGMLKELNTTIANAGSKKGGAIPVKLVVGSNEFEAKLYGLNQNSNDIISN